MDPDEGVQSLADIRASQGVDVSGLRLQAGDLPRYGDYVARAAGAGAFSTDAARRGMKGADWVAYFGSGRF